MKRHSQRAQRVGEQIQRELALLLREHVKDPRVVQVTITAVETSPDLSHAKVFVTHLAGNEDACYAEADTRHDGEEERDTKHRPHGLRRLRVRGRTDLRRDRRL